MSWFDINAENLTLAHVDYSEDAVASTYDGLAALTFSGLSWWVYCLSVVAFLLIVYFISIVIKRFKPRVGSFWKLAALLSVVVCVYIAFFALQLWDEPFGRFASAMRQGTFGDSFGTLNALFSGLAFCGVLITLLFQRKDLSETRNQIANQQIESQFYSMLGLQQEIVKSLDLQRGAGGEVISRGRDCFRNWAAGIKHYYDLAEGSHEVKIAVAIESLLLKHKADLGVYFRSLYSVFRYVYNCKHMDRAQFGLVVRSLLSDHELVVLFYNSLNPKGKKFATYIYEFALFDNIEVELLLDVKDVNLFGFQAYGSNRKILEMLVLNPGQT